MGMQVKQIVGRGSQLLSQTLSPRVLQRRIERWLMLYTWQRPGRPAPLTPLEEQFCLWNAERLGIGLEQSRARLQAAKGAITGGFGGAQFRFFSGLTHDIFRVFFDDSEREAMQAYAFHGHLHFLRMLSRSPANQRFVPELAAGLAGEPAVTIYDFGCGLGQFSFALARRLKERGAAITLVLADIPTVRKEFLLWLGTREGYATSFIDITPERPVPTPPPCHVVVATEVFEHLHDPSAAFDAINEALLPGGYLVTNIADHEEGFFHVSPRLAALRARVAALAYTELHQHQIFRKALSLAVQPA